MARAPSAKDLIKASLDALRDAEKKKLLIDEKTTDELLKEATDYAEQTGVLDSTNVWNEMAIIVAKMEQWLVDIKVKKANFEKISRENNAYARQQLGEDASAYQIKGFFAKKTMRDTDMARSYVDAQNALLQAYLEGYKLWEAFRSYATGQSLKYTIMYKDQGKLYEAEVSFADFLKFSNFRLSGNLKQVVENDKVVKEKFNYAISISDFNKGTEKYQNVKEVGIFYNQLVDIIKNHLKMTDTNYGQIYETYIEIKNDWKNFPIEKGLTVPYVGHWLTERRLSVIQQMVRANMKDKTSGRTAGDQGLFQAKNIAQNEAKLGAVRTLISDIQAIVDGYESTKKQSGDIRSLGELLKKYLTVGNVRGNGNISLSDSTIHLNSAARLSIEKKFLIE